MTWDELQKRIAQMSEEERKADVIVFIEEWEEIDTVEVDTWNGSNLDVLDKGWPFLTTEKK